MSWLAEYCTSLRERDPGPDTVGTAPPARPFAAALRRPKGIAVIAEIKFRSPSMGELRREHDVERVAASYAAHGASALSVLVDERHFGGRLEYLGRARETVDLPLLAKGFLVRPSDLREARAAGADAVLLIAACLERLELERLHGLALDLGMEALVELHGDGDLEKIRGLDLALVGVNHRNLDTLAMDMGLSGRLAPRLPAGATRVAESGIRTPADLARLGALGYHAVLAGTRFMPHADPGLELGRLLGRLP